MTSETFRGLAVHVCADLPSAVEHLPGSPVRSGRDTLTRMSRVCAAAGIEDQRYLVGAGATAAGVRDTLARAAKDIDPYGLLVLTYTGHSDRRLRDERGKQIVQWCLYDGGVRLQEIADMLGGIQPTGRVIVVADTCYAGAFARYADVSSALVLLGACADRQTTISGVTSDFVVRLENLIYPGGMSNPSCVSYRWLEEQLQRDTPDAERPYVWTNRVAAWEQRPFDLEPLASRSAWTRSRRWDEYRR